MRNIKRWGVGLGVSLGAVVIGVATAFACTSLSTLNLSQASGAPGTNITVTGSSFSSNMTSSSPVTLHWNAIDGPQLGQAITPDASGAIGPVTVTIPQNLAPGFYTIIASQTQLSNGQAAFGTPARAAFQVTGNGVGAVGGSTAPTASAVTSSSNGLGAGVVGLLVALGVGGLVLFGLGAATFVGSYRRVPSASRVRK